jgi:16S rRNA (guanine(966)-N(2))-methyltransferase RsmD
MGYKARATTFDVMRVIAGTLGGRRLTSVPGSSTRPTADRVREALFSRLQSRYGLAGITVLDLFAGTGALGIEALSRGASRLVSVEIDRRAARVLIANLQACELDGRTEVLVRDAVAAIDALQRRRLAFEGVFLDPPYGRGLALRALEVLGVGPLVMEGGWVSVEADRDEELPQRVGRLLRVREDVYGDTKLVLYELGATDAETGQ